MEEQALRLVEEYFPHWRDLDFKKTNNDRFGQEQFVIYASIMKNSYTYDNSTAVTQVILTGYPTEDGDGEEYYWSLRISTATREFGNASESTHDIGPFYSFEDCLQNIRHWASWTFSLCSEHD